MTRHSVDEVDHMRREGKITWDEYALLLKGGSFMPHPEITRILKEIAQSIRDREGRRLDLQPKFTGKP